MKDVYIIIPVYKGFKETRACISSVKKYTRNRHIVIINDASPDPEVNQYIAFLKQPDPFIHVYENSSNMGFVKTANLGFDFNKSHDVIILNNDTVVTANWVEKMQAWAYADPNAATVTPMSNSATICSYPVTCRQNQLPDGMTPDDLNLLFEKAGIFQEDELIDIPTGIGFCLYIKREYLDKTGYFNTDIFGTGYGEENDFCLKCTKLGGRHLAATDTFIFHNEGVSFGPEQKQKQSASAIKILNRLYPEYDTTIQHFLEADPLIPVRRKVDFLRFAETRTKGILMISHGKGGGIDKHIQELSLLVENRGMHPFVLTPVKDRGVAISSTASSEEFHLEIDAKNWLNKLVTVLNRFHIRHLHYHHISGFHKDIFHLPGRAGLQYDFTLHDFYMFCPNISGYIEDTDYFCGFVPQKPCRKCPTQKDAIFYHPYRNDIDMFRKKNRSFLRNARKIISPSHSTKMFYNRYYPELIIAVHDHPETYNFKTGFTPPPLVPVQPFNEKNPLNIALLGGLSPKKGRKVLDGCLALSRKKKLPVRWILIGYTDLTDTADENDYIITGAYKKNALPELFKRHDIHIVLLPAKWPETYSYTLSECFALKCPVMVPDIGALGERVKKTGGGIILPSPITPAIVMEQIEFLISHPEKLYDLKKVAAKHPDKDHIDYFFTIYNSLTFTNPCNKNSADYLKNRQTEYKKKHSREVRVCDQLISMSAHKRLTCDLQSLKMANKLTQNHVGNLEIHVKNMEIHAENLEALLKSEHEGHAQVQNQLNQIENQKQTMENELQTLKKKLATFRGVAWSAKMLVKKILLSITGKKGVI